MTTRTEINNIKSQIRLAWSGQLRQLQYHPVTDEISAYGRNLRPPQYARGNIDRYGYARYTVAQRDPQGKWETVHGERLSS